MKFIKKVVPTPQPTRTTPNTNAQTEPTNATASDRRLARAGVGCIPQGDR